MKKEMLINVLQPEECRIAIIEDGQLEELYVERTSQESYVGNVYKGKIVNIEPSIQAAFVDFGIGRNGFLHVSDVDPAYYRHVTQRGQPRAAPPRHRGDVEEQPPRDRPPPRSRTPVEEEDYQPPPRAQRRPVREEYEEDYLPPPRRPAPPPVDVGFVAEPAPAAEPEVFPNDDPYAGLAADIGPVHEDASDRDVESGEPVRGGRGRGRGRGRREQSESARRQAPEPRELVEEIRQTPPPLPPKAPAPPQVEEESSFGAGLWGDDLPPPFMPGAERRTDDDDEFNEPPYAGSGEEDAPPRDRGRGGRGRNGERPRGNGGAFRRLGRDGDGHQKPLIQDIFKRGQEVLVQVIKEGIGTKGPTLSTYISIAGRYLVLMPGLSRIGVSRKIDDAEQRHRLRDILTELNPPAGVGFIIRTAGVDRNKKELQNDLGYLLRIWQVVVKRIKSQKAGSVIYQESDMITRTIRDTFSGDVDSIIIDEPVAYQHALEFLQGVMPRYASRLKLYSETEPLFHKFGIEGEIAKIQQKKVPLPMGGSLVIEQTEALVAIDVNSGNFRADGNNADETAFQMNVQAAKEIARQLRLRDLGGVIVNDFIDMKDDKHRRAVEKAMREAVKRDRARTKVLRISQFGLIEMTRQRIRPSLKRSVFQECTHCGGNGHVKTTESMSIEVMRLIQLAACKESIRRIEVRVHAAVADYLVNRRRREIAEWEDRGSMAVVVTGAREVSPEQMDFLCYDGNGNEVLLQPKGPPPRSNPTQAGRGRR